MSSSSHSFEDVRTDLGFSPLTSPNGELFGRLETWSRHLIRYLTEVQAS